LIQSEGASPGAVDECKSDALEKVEGWTREERDEGEMKVGRGNDDYCRF